MRKTVRLPTIQNVVPGGTFTLACPVGMTYDRIIFKLGGTTFDESHIQNLEVIVNGKTIQTWKTGSELRLMNEYWGRGYRAGYLPIYFKRPEFRPLEQQRLTALGTADVSTLTVRGDISSTAVAPTLEAFAIQSEPTPLGLISKIKRFDLSAAVAGSFEVDSIPRGPRVLAAHFLKSDINALTCEVNSVKVLEGDKSTLEELQKESGRVPQSASASHLDFTLEGDILQALNTSRDIVQDLRYRLDLATAGNVPVYVEWLDSFSGV